MPEPHQHVTVSAGTAFKIGFYAAFGFLAAAILPWAVIFVLVASTAAYRAAQ